MALYNGLDHSNIHTLSDIQELLLKHSCEKVLIKKLVKNNNDKNQVYFHHDASLLNSIFDLTFRNRKPSVSKKKKNSVSGTPIPEAIFNHFFWLATDGQLHQVLHCKGILYLQFPEVRLSGFISETGLMPRSMSVTFVKQNPEVARYLAIGATHEGTAVAVMIVSPGAEFQRGFLDLPLFADSKICRLLSLKEKSLSDRLKSLLKDRIAGKDIKGSRLKADGTTVPFTGTQVHGYTLEHELGITSNSSKNGDIFGIELKCFTSKKLTLFTPEPDGGLYAENFEKFMLKYGYRNEENVRFTGLHRVGTTCKTSHLSLVVLCSHKKQENDDLVHYESTLPFTDQMKNLQVVLRDLRGEIAASWSLTRLLNNWGVKHNEVVYVPAKVGLNHVPEEIAAGYAKRVRFGNEFLWCRKTTLERMINAIASGVIFLDPGTKLDPTNAKNNKRRSQWRINNIYRDSAQLYETVERVNL